MCDGLFGFIGKSVHVFTGDDEGVGAFAISPFEGAVALEGESVWFDEVDEKAVVEDAASPFVCFVVDEVVLVDVLEFCDVGEVVVGDEFAALFLSGVDVVDDVAFVHWWY